MRFLHPATRRATWRIVSTLGSRRALAALVTGFGIVCATSVLADPGDLDRTYAGFGSAGQYTLTQNLTTHVVQPDGRIVLAGHSGDNLIVVRRRVDGTFDGTFGNGGTMVLSNLHFPTRARSVALQPDGRIVVAGYTDTGTADYLVIRLTTGGALDPAFNGSGYIHFPISSDTDIAEKVLIQPDGKIVLAGYSYVGGDWDFSAARLNTNGALDPTFSGDGKTTIGFGADDKCYDAALQDDGRIVLAGGKQDGFPLYDSDFALARLNVDGTLDPSFDGDGKLTTGFGDVETARAVAIHDGKIIAAGAQRVARYLVADGSLDPTLDGDGKLSVSSVWQFTDLAMMGDGRMVLMEYALSGEGILHRLNVDGSSDYTIDQYGYGTGQIGPADPSGGDAGTDQFPSLSLMPDGRIVMLLPGVDGCGLYRMWPGLTSDTGGWQTAGFDDAAFPSGSQEVAYALARQQDGRFIAAGYVAEIGYNESDFGLMRFLPDGSIDDSFGSHGRASLDFSNDDACRAVAIQPDGRIVAAGYEGTGNGVNFLVARFEADGTPDPTFGFFGDNVADFFGGIDYGTAVALTQDGRVLVAGPVFDGSHFEFGVAQLTSDGALDASFGSGGKQTFDFPGASSQWVSSLLVEPSGRVVLGGFVDGDFALVAFTSSGALDGTFGSSGYARTDLGGNDYLNALGFGTDGRIYAAGSHETGGHTVFALARYTSAGALAKCNTHGCTLWPSGFVTKDWFAEGAAYAIDVRTDGQLVLAGAVGQNVGWAQFAQSNGTETTHGQWTLPGDDQSATGVCFDGLDHVLLGGYQRLDDDHNFALVRFETTTNTNPVGVEPGAVAGLRLAPARPNPVGEGTTLDFELPTEGPVRLTVFDVAGRRVRTLAHGTLAAGHHTLAWDGADEQGARVTPGVFFVRLVAAGKATQREVVLLR